jgi:hypothetical protein
MVSNAEAVFQAAPAGELVFSIRGSSRDGQVVRVRSPKCTIGSGPQSTVRLHAAGVQPTHCLIVRGPRATVIRRWTSDTLLNGADFTDAELVPGDRLRIGPIEFEVLGVPRSPDAPLAAGIEACQQELDRRAAELDAREQEFARRAEEIQSRAAEQASQPEQLSRRAEELEAKAGRLEVKARELDDQAERLGSRAREVQTHDDRLKKARHDLDAQSEQLAARDRELESQAEELDKLAERLAAQAEELEAERAELEARLAALEAAGSAPDAEPQAEPPEEAGEQSAREEPTEIRFESVSRDAPLTSEDVFRRMGTVPLSPGDADRAGQEEASPAEPRHVNRPEGIETGEANEKPEEEVEESIDQYMAQLLRRVGGISQVASPAGSPAPRRDPQPQPDSHERAEEHAVAEPAGPQCGGPGELSPRATAPEKGIDLSAMRELANFSARQAIDRYARQTLSRTIQSKLVVTVVSALVGAALLWFWWHDRSNQLSFYGAAVSFVIAIFWGVQDLVLTSRKIAGLSARRDAPAESDNDDA